MQQNFHTTLLEIVKAKSDADSVVFASSEFLLPSYPYSESGSRDSFDRVRVCIGLSALFNIRFSIEW